MAPGTILELGFPWGRGCCLTPPLSAEAPPPEVLPLQIEVESTEPLPPAHGKPRPKGRSHRANHNLATPPHLTDPTQPWLLPQGATPQPWPRPSCKSFPLAPPLSLAPPAGDSALLLRLRRGPALAWQGALPPGEYLLSPPGRQGAPPPLPRLVLPAGAQLGPGLLLSSAPRGLFLRVRPGDGPAPVTVRGPHAPHGPLQQGALLQPFDARRFRDGESNFREGLRPTSGGGDQLPGAGETK